MNDLSITRVIRTQRLRAQTFAPFGQVLDNNGTPEKIINRGLCRRFHDRAALAFGDGRAGLSIFDAAPRMLPYDLDLLERHPDGSQAFVPMHQHEWLVTVAPDENGVPGEPLAFVAEPGQAINFDRGVWHGVLTPLNEPGLFAVIDRIGPGDNLEEHPLDMPYRIERGE
ncbi:Ureidoglycolate hydrolase [Jannaschia seosinensis]|uniref:Ureidoglycolate hydrolase n=1 Tax=Jannaschia seosinensis TaxID=313367 RepID=A0A0M7BBV2_9RHOB|nr:ureidoglycolate lyase [Jannaschia seosinensis]CUH39393.1 Ureidoglycolate hydrolase [Jannaschia seosinensis]